MAEYRFLSMTKGTGLPTFIRIEAESRMDAIELFANQNNLVIRQISDETVSFHRQFQQGPRRQIFYSVSGCDPWLKLLFG